MRNVNKFIGILDNVDDLFVDEVSTNPERIVRKLLTELGFVVKHYKKRSEFDKLNTIYEQYAFKRKRIDFALPSAQIAIEVDGDYWHANFTTKLSAAQSANKLKDHKKEKSLHRHGWKLIRLKEKDVIDKPEIVKEHLYMSIVKSLDL